MIDLKTAISRIFRKQVSTDADTVLEAAAQVGWHPTVSNAPVGRDGDAER
ncbi:MAG: hypothetical protein QHC67_15310 [Sphingobium sp.]|nr:hypothetical protein [Sphingobium sp.]MDX3911167.1 hypothetical protein [Sphingobium sp.]